MRAKISLAQVQKGVLAPSMQQSIEILILPITELSQTIDQELQENPLLEIDEDKLQSADQRVENIINFNQERREDRPNLEYETGSDDDDSREISITKSTPIEDYLLQQLKLEITDPLEFRIGEVIIGNLDEDGYLKVPVAEIAELLGLTDLKLIEKVLFEIQNFEPIGVAARDIKECLLIQAHYKFNGNGTLLCEIIQNHFEELGKRRYLDIARKLKITEERVKELARLISRLEPKPARNFQPDEANIYIKPDITIIKSADDTYQIQINNDSLPPLRINAFYQKMLKSPQRSQEEVTFIKEKMRNAVLFIRSIEQRHQTLREIAQYLLTTQREFFESGHEALKPMILQDVALAISRNESTISRAISNKYMDTPQGIFPMKFFFSQAVSDNGNGVVARQSILEEIRNLISEEDKSKPFSDQEIQDYFNQKGTDISRRTINKYRKILRILPSHLRKT